MDTILALLNTEAAMALLVSLVVGGLFLWIRRKPEIEKYTGLLITACKWAEKTIPDDTANKALRRADEALRMFIERYEAVTGKTASASIKEAVALALPEVHDHLEAEKTL